MNEFLIPKNPGLEKLPEDKRDFNYRGIFGAEKYPRKFRRPLPDGIDIPRQRNVPACVNCAFTFVNQYKSRVNDNNDVNLSWRYLHAKTGEYGRGRHLRTVAKWLQQSGQPQDIFCADDPILPPDEFMEINLGTPGEFDAQKRRIGAYTFLTPILDEICPAVVKEPLVITLGGDNDDWRKPFDQIVRQTKQPRWWHAIALWDYDLDEGWLGIYNWWNDGYRRISIDYPLTGALSFRDLPDKENDMLKILTDGRDQFILGKDGKVRFIYNVETLNNLHGAGIVDKNVIEGADISKFERGGDIIIVNPE